MDTPTAADVRLWSNVGFAERGYPEDDPDRLDTLVERAVSWFQKVSGRTLDDIDPTDNDVPLINEAIQMLVEWRVMSSQDEVVETAGDFDLIGNFSAGNYSETRRADNRRPQTLHPWPALNSLLYQLLDPSMRDSYEAIGITRPELDWDVAKDVIDANRNVSTPFGAWSPLWDGLP